MLSILAIIVLLISGTVLGVRLYSYTPVGLTAIGAMLVDPPSENGWYTVTLVTVSVLAFLSLVVQLTIDERAKHRNAARENTADFSAIIAGMVTLCYRGWLELLKIPTAQWRVIVLLALSAVIAAVWLVISVRRQKVAARS